MSDLNPNPYPDGRDAQRWKRKCRQWGLHGHDRLRLITRNRSIHQHHYLKWWASRRKDAAIKWMTLYHDFFRRHVKDRIERRRLVAEDVKKHIAAEHYEEG